MDYFPDESETVLVNNEDFMAPRNSRVPLGEAFE